MGVVFGRSGLPVLADCDVAVVGGSFGGVAAALALARAGRKVAVVEPRTYLGREVTAMLRPWVQIPDEASPSDLPQVVRACVEASGTFPIDGEVPLWLRAIKIRLEDLLLLSSEC